MYYVFRPNKQKSRMSLCGKPISKSEYKVNYIILNTNVNISHQIPPWPNNLSCYQTWFYIYFYCMSLIFSLVSLSISFLRHIWCLNETTSPEVKSNRPREAHVEHVSSSFSFPQILLSGGEIQLHLGTIWQALRRPWSCDITKHGLNKDKR